MTPLFRKLNLKDQLDVLIVAAPPEFDSELAAISNVVSVHRRPEALSSISFALIFATTEAEVAAASAAILPRAEGDAVIWFAYPKKSSRRYSSEMHRDRGWDAVGDAGFEPVRQVAIDAGWSALRFRRTSFIKRLKRSPAMRLSPEGKERAQAGRS